MMEVKRDLSIGGAHRAMSACIEGYVDPLREILEVKSADILHCPTTLFDYTFWWRTYFKYSEEDSKAN
jgi:hypothetical protein